MKKTVNPNLHFTTKVKINGECLEWTDKINKRTGYGLFWDSNRAWLAHQYAYFAVFGIKSTHLLTLDHLCKNTKCVNINHLELVRHKENLLRGNTLCAINASKRYCKFGHEFSVINTYVYKTKTGWGRQCKLCMLSRHRSWRANPLNREKELNKRREKRRLVKDINI